MLAVDDGSIGFWNAFFANLPALVASLLTFVTAIGVWWRSLHTAEAAAKTAAEAAVVAANNAVAAANNASKANTAIKVVEAKLDQNTAITKNVAETVHGIANGGNGGPR